MRRVPDQRAWLLIEAWLLFAFVLAYRMFGDLVPFPAPTMDEHAHYSYTLDLIRRHAWWPDFTQFPLTDLATGKATHALNYLNHPPQFYWLMKLVHEAFPDASLSYFRVVPLGITLFGLGLMLRLGYLLPLSLTATGVYALFPFLLHVQQLSGFYNNDALALLGGALACLGSFYWLKPGHTRRGLAYMLLGVLLASVKLTGLALVSAYVLAVFALCPSPRRFVPFAVPFFALLVLGLAALPYLYFWFSYGSPVPATPGQAGLLLHEATRLGWLAASRMEFLPWLSHMLSSFADQFPDDTEITFLPLLWLTAAWCFCLKRGLDAPIVKAGLIATVLLLILHLAFSWPRYQAYGWLDDALLRYYFPLLPAYCAAAAMLFQGLSGRRESG